MATIGTTELQQYIGRQQPGYAFGLPAGVSFADSNGFVAPILTSVYPSTGANGVAVSGMMIFDPAGPALKVWDGSAWKSATLS